MGQSNCKNTAKTHSPCFFLLSLIFSRNLVYTNSARCLRSTPALRQSREPTCGLCSRAIHWPRCCECSSRSRERCRQRAPTTCSLFLHPGNSYRNSSHPDQEGTASTTALLVGILLVPTFFFSFELRVR